LLREGREHDEARTPSKRKSIVIQIIRIVRKQNTAQSPSGGKNIAIIASANVRMPAINDIVFSIT
jgi:hypothetical protein